jgi:hypothetical protein
LTLQEANMMDDHGTAHPDEGTIHAWLDGALSADDSAMIAAHVAECADCAARVAEARGLIAGASRVISELDETPAPAVRVAASPNVSAPPPSVWHALRITPARAAIAAVLLVAVAVTMTMRSSARTDAAARDSTVVASVPAPEDHPLTAPPASTPEAQQNLANRLQVEQPVRTVERPKEPGVVIPPAESIAKPSAALADANAGARVAEARMSIAVQRDTTSARVDRTAVGRAAVPSTANREAVAQPGAAPTAAAAAAPLVTGCYRVDAVAGSTGKWGDVALPFVIAMDSTGVVARVLTTGGTDTQARAVVMKSSTDSLSFQLRRIGFAGTLAVGGDGATRQGFAKSLRVPAMEQTVTVTTRRVGCPAP